MSVVDACRVCHSIENLGSCARCYRAYYCLGKECQKLDWNEHKRFCNKGESKELATLRRDLCLDVIRKSPTFLHSFFLQQNAAKSESCYLVRPHEELQYFSKHSIKEIYESLNNSPDSLTEEELCFEMGRTFGKGAIPVLYVEKNLKRCYLFSSREAAELRRVINYLPKEIHKMISTQIEEHILQNFAPEDVAEATRITSQRVLSSKLLGGESAGPGGDEGEF